MRLNPKIADRLLAELRDGGGKFERGALEDLRRYRTNPTDENRDAALAALRMLPDGRRAELRQAAGI